MKSIRRGFVLLSLISILVAVLVVGSISTVIVIDSSTRYAATLLNLTCENEVKDLDKLVEGIEDSVEVEASFAEDRAESLEQFVNDGAYRESYTHEIEALFSDIARDTEGAVSFYFHYDEDLLGAPDGFRYDFDVQKNAFVPAQVLDFSKYSREDPLVASYYQAKSTGQALWTAPTDTVREGVMTVGYIVPVYCDGTCIGVLGMDLDFDIIVKKVSEITLFDTGYAYLTDELGRVLYHPAIEYGVSLITGDEDDVPEVDRSIISGTTGDEILSYDYQGHEKNLTIRTMQNGMRLCLSADSAEIHATRNELVILIVCATAIIGVIVVVVSLFVSRRMLRPLNDLTEAAKQVASGNLDVEILSSETAEVKSLIESYQKTVKDLKDQMAIIDDMARHDGLTGLLNKTAYNERVEVIDAAIAAGEKPRFTVLMFDVDTLKEINDTYGHECGDFYIKRSVQAVGESFPSLELYRIGGDEVVAIAEGDATDGVDAGVRKLAEIVEHDRATEEEPWRRAAITCGYAHFRPGSETSVAEVFVRADAAMYEHKHHTHS